LTQLSSAAPEAIASALDQITEGFAEHALKHDRLRDRPGLRFDVVRDGRAEQRAVGGAEKNVARKVPALDRRNDVGRELFGAEECGR